MVASRALHPSRKVAVYSYVIHVIITSANVPNAYEARREQYVRSIKSCLQYSEFFDSYTVLECVSAHEEYLDPFNTIYSTIGNPFPNKGLNEMRHVQGYLEGSSLAANDSIIKLSGRYIIEDPYFFERVAELHDEYESMFKNDDDVFVGNGYHTFFYYMKKALLLETIASLEYSMENDRPIEWDVKNFLLTRETNIEIDRLGVMAYQGANSEKIFRC
jgi:hypothetical protein